MSDKLTTIFAPEQVSELAKENVDGLCLAAVAYLKEQNLSIDEYWAFVGRRFAPAWQQGSNAKEVATEVALSSVTIGGNLHSLSGDESKAEAVIGGWPTEESLTFFSLTQEDADSLWGVFKPISEHLGFDYEWHRRGDKVTMSFSRQNIG